MDITFDPKKNETNILKRGLSFDLVKDFDFQTALFWFDNRKNYPEARICALGFVGHRVYSLVFSKTDKGIRVISFRKANKREVNRYEQKT